MKRKGQTVSFHLPGHYLTKLETKANLMNSDSKDLCAKQLTIEALENSPMRELQCRMGELEWKLDRLLQQLPQSCTQLSETLAKALFFMLYEAAGIDINDAAKIANHLCPDSIQLPSEHRIKQAC